MRRLRVRRRSRVSSEAVEAIKTKVREVGEMQERVDELQAQIKERMEELNAEMDAIQLDHIESGTFEAVHEVPRSNSISYVDPRDAYKLLEDDEFFECIKVQMQKLGEYLSGKQIEKIKHVEPAKEKDPVLKVRRISRHVGG